MHSLNKDVSGIVPGAEAVRFFSKHFLHPFQSGNLNFPKKK